MSAHVWFHVFDAIQRAKNRRSKKTKIVNNSWDVLKYCRIWESLQSLGIISLCWVRSLSGSQNYELIKFEEEAKENYPIYEYPKMRDFWDNQANQGKKHRRRFGKQK